MKTKNQSPFQGTWVATRTQSRTTKNTWIDEKRFRFGTCKWIFHQKDAYGHDEIDTYKGILDESGSETDNSSRDFAYFTFSSLLHLDCSDIAEDGFLNRCIEDVYHVEIRKSKLILYDIFEVNDDKPERFLYRVILRRDNLFNRLIGAIGRGFTSGT